MRTPGPGTLSKRGLSSLLAAACLAHGAASGATPARADSADDGPAGAPAPDAEEGAPQPRSQGVPDPGPSELAAAKIERSLDATLLAGLRALDWERVEAALDPAFAGWFPRPGDGARIPDSFLTLERYSGDQHPVLARDELLDALRAQLADCERLERARLALSRIEGEAGATEHCASALLTLAGLVAGGGRMELHAELRIGVSKGADGVWTVRRLALTEGHRAGAPHALLADVAGPTGFHLQMSYDNRELATSLVDEWMTPLVGGVSAIDWDGDGFVDLLVTRRRQITVLFLNDGRGGFTREPLPIEVPAHSPHAFLFLDLDGDGLEELVSGAILGYERDRAFAALYTRRNGDWTLLERALEFRLPRGVRDVEVVSIVPADVDGDGLLDLYFCVHRDSRSGGFGSNTFAAFDGGDDLLFMNQGGLEFREESNERGIAGRQYTTAAFFHDFDGDGDVDLLTTSFFGPDWYYRNDGEGHFERQLQHPYSGVPASTSGIAVADPTGTGTLELYRAGWSDPVADRIQGFVASSNELLRAALAGIARGGRLQPLSDPGDGSARRAEKRGVEDAGLAFAPVFFDLDGDGDRELLVTGGLFSHRDERLPDWSTFHWRQVVADAVSALHGAPRMTMDPRIRQAFRGSYAGHEPERLFYAAGEKGAAWLDAAYVLGLDLAVDGRSAVAVDFDGDGDLDLALLSLQGLHLYENRSPARSFARISLEASGSPREALGAVVTVVADGRAQSALVQATSGFQSQVPLELHFGLGAAREIELVRVRWPSGATQEWSTLPVGVRILLREHDPEAAVSPVPAWPEESRPRPGASPSVSLRATRLTGGDGLLATTGRPAVLAFWSPRSTESVSDLAQLAAEAQELGSKLRAAAILAHPDEVERAREIVREQEIRFSQFVADDALLARFFGAPTGLAVPATFLFDPEGRVARVWHRPLARGELATLLQGFDDEPGFAFDLVALAGRSMQRGEPQIAVEYLRRALRSEPRLAAAHHAIGTLFALSGDAQKAAEAFARAAALDPDMAQAQYNLGTARMLLGRPLDAAAAFEAALEVRPGDVETLLALGTARVEAGELEPAFEAFDRATQLVAESPTAWYLRGRVLADLGRTAEARASLERAVELAPELEIAREALEELPP